MITLVNLLFAVKSYLSPDGVFDVDHLFVKYNTLRPFYSFLVKNMKII